MELKQLKKIISGGQTGIDQMGLEVAKQLGIPTGGLAPKGYQTEKGPDERLSDFSLLEHSSMDYSARTRANVLESSGTVLFGDSTLGGTKLTLDFCVAVGKPYIINPTAVSLRQWLITNRIDILNVAGNRASQLTTEALTHYRAVLTESLQPDRWPDQYAR